MQTKVFEYGINGEGVAKVDGKIMLIPYALIDEEVEIEIEKDFSNYALAKATNIIKQSNNRVSPSCPYFYVCGGCDIQHMDYAEQLKFKTMHVKKTIKKITGLDVEVENAVPSCEQYNYRNKASFVVTENEIGFYKRNSKTVVDIKNCDIVSNNINKILTLAREFFNGTNYVKDIKNIVVREIENQILVGIVAKKFLKLDDFYSKLQQNFKNIGLFLVKNKRNDAVVLTNDITHIGGIKEIKINNFGLTYFVDLLGFHQTNIDIQNKIYCCVLELINPNDNIINGFSGDGLLSAIIAQKAKHVYGIELNKSSHLSAEKLKKDNKINNLTNICGDFNKEIKNLKNIDTLILDPPKKGLGLTPPQTSSNKDPLAQAILNKQIKNIIYISCNPIALAKDLRYLKEFYIIDKIVPYDMFPNTKSVETLVKLKLKEN